jgi:hypothetical protein
MIPPFKGGILYSKNKEGSKGNVVPFKIENFQPVIYDFIKNHT